MPTKGPMNSDGRGSLSLSSEDRCLRDIDIFVIAGGLGTRIKPVLGDLPKLLAPISGRAYLAYLLDWLRQFGAARIVLGLGHQAGAVIDFLERIKSSYERYGNRDRDRAQAAWHCRRDPVRPTKLRTDPVLVLNGDSFADADLCKFVGCISRAKAKATYFARGRQCWPLRPDRTRRHGRIRNFVEKDPNFHGDVR